MKQIDTYFHIVTGYSHQCTTGRSNNRTEKILYGIQTCREKVPLLHNPLVLPSSYRCLNFPDNGSLGKLAYRPQMHLKLVDEFPIQFMECNVLFPVKILDDSLQRFTTVVIM